MPSWLSIARCRVSPVEAWLGWRRIEHGPTEPWWYVWQSSRLRPHRPPQQHRQPTSHRSSTGTTTAPAAYQPPQHHHDRTATAPAPLLGPSPASGRVPHRTRPSFARPARDTLSLTLVTGASRRLPAGPKVPVCRRRAAPTASETLGLALFASSRGRLFARAEDQEDRNKNREDPKPRIGTGRTGPALTPSRIEPRPRQNPPSDDSQADRPRAVDDTRTGVGL